MRKRYFLLFTALLLMMGTMGCTSGETEERVKKEVKRIGMVIKIKPEFIEEYKVIHSDSNAGVRVLLAKANMHNFSIFLHQLEWRHTSLSPSRLSAAYNLSIELCYSSSYHAWGIRQAL